MLNPFSLAPPAGGASPACLLQAGEAGENFFLTLLRNQKQAAQSNDNRRQAATWRL